jgi:hypothetical protein
VVTKGSGSIKVRWKKPNMLTITNRDGTTKRIRSSVYGHIAPCTEVTM